MIVVNGSRTPYLSRFQSSCSNWSIKMRSLMRACSEVLTIDVLDSCWAFFVGDYFPIGSAIRYYWRNNISMITASSNFVKNSNNHELINLRVKSNNRRKREMKKSRIRSYSRFVRIRTRIIMDLPASTSSSHPTWSWSAISPLTMLG